MNTEISKPEVQVKLDCIDRAKASLRETVIDLESVIGSQEALWVAAGAMRSIDALERLAQRIAQQEAANG